MFWELIYALCNGLLSIIQISLLSKFFPHNRDKDAIMKINKLLNIFRAPLVKSDFSNVFIPEYEDKEHKSLHIIIGGITVFVIFNITGLFFYKHIFKLLNIDTSIRNYIQFFVSLQTVLFIFIGGCFKSMIDYHKVYRRSIASGRFIGNISRISSTYLTGYFIGGYGHLLGEAVYSMVPTLMYIYYGLRYLKWQLTSISLSFIFKCMIMYANPILEFIVNHYLLSAMKDGIFSQLRLGYTVVLIMFNVTVQPILRNMLSDHNNLTYNLCNLHKSLIFATIPTIFVLPHILKGNISGCNTVIISIIGYSVSNYVFSITKIMATDLNLHGHNTVTFLGNIIRLFIKTILILILRKSIKVFLLTEIISTLCEGAYYFGYLYKSIDLYSYIKTFMYTTLISVAYTMIIKYLLLHIIYINWILRILLFIFMVLGAVVYWNRDFHFNKLSNI